MTATTGPLRPAAATPRRHRSKIVIAGCTTLLGLWLGLTAPSVSPVAPPPLAVGQVAAAAAAAAPAPAPAGAAPADSAAAPPVGAPLVPQPGFGHGPGHGGGRR